MGVEGLVKRFGAEPKEFFIENLDLDDDGVRAYIAEFMTDYLRTERLPKLHHWNLMSARVEDLREENIPIVHLQSKRLANLYVLMLGLFPDWASSRRRQSLTLEEQVYIARKLYEHAFNLGIEVYGETPEMRVIREMGRQIQPSIKAVFGLRGRYDSSVIYFPPQLKKEIINAMNNGIPFKVYNSTIGEIPIDPFEKIIFH